MTADEQLERLLYILSAASGPEGCLLDDLADSLGTTRSRIVQDLEEATARSFYHPAGGADNLQILIDNDRVRVWTTGEFRRPPRLSPREAAAVALAFRILAASRAPDGRQALLDLAERLESALSGGSLEDLREGIAVDIGDRADGEILETLRAATADRRECEIHYLKPGDDASEARIVHPYALLRADNGWYSVGFCRLRAGIRAFRLDRVLRATLLPGTFEPPADFDVDDWLAAGGRVYQASDEIEVAIRYSPRISRWIREKGPVEELPDGGVMVRYRVADPDWAVRHVLQYGPDAEIVEPVTCRESVSCLLGELLGRVSAGARSDG